MGSLEGVQAASRNSTAGGLVSPAKRWGEGKAGERHDVGVVQGEQVQQIHRRARSGWSEYR